MPETLPPDDTPPGFVPLAGTDAPLRWVCEDGQDGTEVSEIPKVGMVFFYDAAGPVHRQEGIDSARWWVFGRANSRRLRVTRLESGGEFTYLVPGIAAGITCNHGCEEPGQCAKVATLCLEMVRE